MKEEYRRAFDTAVDRRGTHSLKWDVKDNELPMWVADMDFKTAPAIIEAIKESRAWSVWLFHNTG